MNLESLIFEENLLFPLSLFLDHSSLTLCVLAMIIDSLVVIVGCQFRWLVLWLVLCQSVSGEMVELNHDLLWESSTVANSTTFSALCPTPPHLRMVYCHGKDVYIHTSFTATTASNLTVNSSFSLDIAEVAFALDRRRGLIPFSILYRKLPQEISQLNNFFCSDSNRQGKFCSECKDGCGIALYGYYGLPCACPCQSYGVALYILLEIGFSSLFFALVLISRIAVLSSKWYGFVLFSQNTMNVGNTYPIFYTLYSLHGHKLRALFDILYGTWNLDFMRFSLPAFCVSPHIGTLGAISTGYISALWPLFIVLMTYLAVELHKRHFKFVVYPWLGLKRFLGKVVYQRISETNLIVTFATLLYLGYLKLMYVSFALLGAIVPYYVQISLGNSSSAAEGNQWLSLDPELSYGSCEHLKYAIPALIIILFCGILLPLTLLLYPFKCVHRFVCGERSRLGREWIALKIFIEAFHGGLKDGTDGTRDYRALPGAYLVLKVFLGLMYALRGVPVLALNLQATYALLAAFSLLNALFYGLAKPYKIRIHNLIDTLLWTLLTTQCVLILVIFSNWKYHRTMVPLLIGISILPGIGLVVFFAIKLLKTTSLCKIMYTKWYKLL